VGIPGGAYRGGQALPPSLAEPTPFLLAAPVGVETTLPPGLASGLCRVHRFFFCGGTGATNASASPPTGANPSAATAPTPTIDSAPPPAGANPSTATAPTTASASAPRVALATVKAEAMAWRVCSPATVAPADATDL